MIIGTVAVSELFSSTSAVTAGPAAFPPPALTDADWLAERGYRLDGDGYLEDIRPARPSRQMVMTAAAAAVRVTAADAAAWLIAYLREHGGTALSSEIRAAGAAEGFSDSLLKKVRLKAGVTFTRAPDRPQTSWVLPPA